VTVVVPDVGEEHFLDLILAVGYTLRLFKTDVTAGLTADQVDALVAADFTEATFTGYSASAITGGSWTTTQESPSTGTNTQRTFTSSADQTAQTIFGYYVTRTTGGQLEWFEDFAGPLVIENLGDAISVTPTITLDDDQEATVTARGIVGDPQSLTANSAGFTGSATTDFAIASVVVDSSRLYAVHWYSKWTLDAAGQWDVNLHVDGTLTDQFHHIRAASSFRDSATGCIVWEPTSGTKAIDVRVVEVAGTSTLVFEAAATSSRRLWVTDIGPRPA
jgi:hypothetical protein